MNEENKARFKYNIIFVAVIAAVFAGVLNLSKVVGWLKIAISLLTPLLVGGCAAFFLNVPMNGYEKLLNKFQDVQRRKKRHVFKQRTIEMVSLVLAVVSFILVLFIVCSVVVPRVAQSFVSVYYTVLESYPKALETIEKYGVDMTFAREWLEEFNIERILNTLKDNAKNIMDTVSSAASSVFGVIVNGVTGIVLAIYILANKRTLGKQIKRILYAFLKKQNADKICEVAKLASNTFSNFLSGQLVECLILWAMFLVVLGVLGFPYAAVISLVIAALAVVPYIGAFTGCAIGVLLILMVEPKRVIWFIIVFLIVQQIENQLIYPRVVGKSVGLPPMWTLLAALLGGKLFGIIGLLFFIPFTAVIYALLQRTTRKRLRNKRLEISEENGEIVDKSDIQRSK